MMKLCVLAIILVACAAAQDCTSCTGDNMCTQNGYAGCCSGTCKNTADQTALGGTCSTTGLTSCCITGYCDGSKCALTGGKSYGCSCSVNSDCATGYCGTGSLCGYANIGVGGPCAGQNQCATGLTCTSNVCTAVALGQRCNNYGSAKVPGAAIDGSNCVFGTYCNYTNGQTGQLVGVCTALIANDGAMDNTRCVMGGTPPVNGGNAGGVSGGTADSCSSGYCTNGISPNVYTYYCKAPNTLSNGNNCTFDWQCPSGSICRLSAAGLTGPSSRTCVAKNTIATGQWCERPGAVQVECGTGLFCSQNSTTGNTGPASTCISGSYKGLAAGSTCWNDDQCVADTDTQWVPHACIKPAEQFGMATGQCNMTVSGTSCVRDSTVLTCKSNGASYGCTCSGAGVNKCTATVVTTDPCASQLTALSALNPMFPGTYASLAYAVSAMGTADQKTTAAKWLCCQACNVYGGVSAAVSAFYGNYATQFTDQSLNCATNTFSASSDSGSSAVRCTVTGSTPPYTRTTAVGGGLGSCPASNTGAGIAVAPSVALLVAVLAVVLALFA